jgi:hypothetical protein
MPPEQQVWLLKRVCRHLWSLLDRRHGDGLSTCEDVLELFSVDARAAVDRTFEATLVLWGRDGVLVEPCRRILTYLLVLPDGQKRVVGEDELLMMAGLQQ